MKHTFTALHSLTADRFQSTLRVLLTIAILTLTACRLSADPVPYPPPPPSEEAAPPPALPPSTRSLDYDPGGIGGGETKYSIGEPTDEEQQFLEYINWARSNANAAAQAYYNTTDPDVVSAYAYFGVDLEEMTNQFTSLIQNLPPLAMNSKLLTATRLHSQDMATNVFQGHFSSTNPPPPHQEGDSPSDRIDYQSYSWIRNSENIFAKTKSVWHGHCAFEVDWGTGPYGMQVPAGHRNTIHTNKWREIGIGVVLGYNRASHDTNGPIVVTQDFATESADTPFITGVTYYDLNSNAFYDLGEGLGDIMVDASNTLYYAETAGSGGYAIPVSGNGSYPLTFSAPHMADVVTNVTITDGENAKQDLVLTYVPPIIDGPTNPTVGQATGYVFTGVAGCTNYTLTEHEFSTDTCFEGAENGSNDVLLTLSAGYNPIIASPVVSGTGAWHLVQPSATDQIIEIDRDLFPRSGAAVYFASRLGWASSDQSAQVHVTTDNGANWTVIYNQNGTGTSGESTYNSRSTSLESYTNTLIRLRFVYHFAGGSYFPQTDVGVGWHIDDITVSNAYESVSSEESTISSDTNFLFTADVTAFYLLDLAPMNRNHMFPAGTFELLAEPAPLVVTITDAQVSIESNQFIIPFFVTNGTPTSLTLEQTESLMIDFTNVPALTPEDLGGGYYRFLYDLNGATQQFFRIIGEY